MTSILLGIISGTFTYFFLSYFRQRRINKVIPSTYWQRGKMKVRIVFVDKERVYFMTKDECICSLLKDDFITQFEEVTNDTNSN